MTFGWLNHPYHLFPLKLTKWLQTITSHSCSMAIMIPSLINMLTYKIVRLAQSDRAISTQNRRHPDWHKVSFIASIHTSQTCVRNEVRLCFAKNARGVGPKGTMRANRDMPNTEDDKFGARELCQHAKPQSTHFCLLPAHDSCCLDSYTLLPQVPSLSV